MRYRERARPRERGLPRGPRCGSLPLGNGATTWLSLFAATADGAPSSAMPVTEVLNSRIPVPSDRPTSGNRFAPKSNNPSTASTTKCVGLSRPAPIGNLLPSVRGNSGVEAGSTIRDPRPVCLVLLARDPPTGRAYRESFAPEHQSVHQAKDGSLDRRTRHTDLAARSDLTNREPNARGGASQQR